ncbi:hypothetical protein SAMN05443245_3423 [Paraburkholderia fungorum]|uniref:DUF2513 domain-containing protein n=1 Tax=Paraburkholderia fungorum TaxID=134537 RepID=A0A1H1H071_9BURK|nr:hypothetical protein [Paraburkholderia fungorum]SDR18895.1 hypothetical protein SAMN05443245_3423 [Paraburkholderia fungorum]
MKRNNELVTKILKMLEDSDRRSLSIDTIRATIAGDDKVKRDEVTHHVYIMGDVGYLNISEPAAIRLTWQGHDQLRPNYLATQVSGLSV